MMRVEAEGEGRGGRVVGQVKCSRKEAGRRQVFSQPSGRCWYKGRKVRRGGDGERGGGL